MHQENCNHQENQENQQNPQEIQVTLIEATESNISFEVEDFPTELRSGLGGEVSNDQEEETDKPDERQAGSSELLDEPGRTLPVSKRLCSKPKRRSVGVAAEKVPRKLRRLADKHEPVEGTLGKRAEFNSVSTYHGGEETPEQRHEAEVASHWAGDLGLGAPDPAGCSRVARSLRKPNPPENRCSLPQRSARPRLDSQSSFSDFEDWPEYIFCNENEYQQRVQTQRLEAYPFLIQRGNHQIAEIDNRDHNHRDGHVQDEFVVGDQQQLVLTVTEMPLISRENQGPSVEQLFNCGPLVDLELIQQELPLQSTITWYHSEATHFFE